MPCPGNILKTGTCTVQVSYLVYNDCNAKGLWKCNLIYFSILVFSITYLATLTPKLTHNGFNEVTINVIIHPSLIHLLSRY